MCQVYAFPHCKPRARIRWRAQNLRRPSVSGSKCSTPGLHLPGPKAGASLILHPRHLPLSLSRVLALFKPSPTCKMGVMGPIVKKGEATEAQRLLTRPQCHSEKQERAWLTPQPCGLCWKVLPVRRRGSPGAAPPSNVTLKIILDTGGSILTLSSPHLEGQSICISLEASLQLECTARITPEDRWLSSHK